MTEDCPHAWMEWVGEDAECLDCGRTGKVTDDWVVEALRRVQGL